MTQIVIFQYFSVLIFKINMLYLLLVWRIITILVLQLRTQRVFELDPQHAVVHSRHAVDLDSHNATVAEVGGAEAGEDQIVTRGEPGNYKVKDSVIIQI